ncbi:MAG: NADH-quinone oxidoreductase subunit NuoF [Candidatus Aegiribacteria sp.]|nr:NADH-quinone oxidoreductase subunit NuoF [Candidatus Aegiribacteria sp.]
MSAMNKKILDQLAQNGLKSLYPEQIRISVGMATCGLATGAQAVFDQFEKILEQTDLDAVLSKTGCLGFCQREPIVDLFIPGIPRLTYIEMTPEIVIDFMDALQNATIPKVNLLCRYDKELLLDDVFRQYDLSEKKQDELSEIPLYEDIPFFAKQQKIALRNCGIIDPGSIGEYIARGGYRALLKVLGKMSPEALIEEVKCSGLRGRGGGGFPTGLKWQFTRKTEAEDRYIVCNADEGDPGAYMDRSILEGDPHSIIEGMIIGGYAIGASTGFIYCRTEYPLAIERLVAALDQAHENGLLGENIFDSGFSFDIQIREGSGAFVCGEETSLMHSIEGVSPEPGNRPPFPSESGLWENPTNINNVETWANIPAIVTKGSSWYAGIGTEKSKGTKVFSLVGKVRNNGLVEVPMGISLREIIYEIGEGIPDDREFKAVQTGGPSGGCIPASLLDLPVDYERLAEAGSIMGSGGMVVMDSDTCVVDIARYFLEFTNDESCGKCTSCRDGSKLMLDILSRITEGDGKPSDVDFLLELGEAVTDASQCGLGQTLANPVLSTIEYFRDEYDAHIEKAVCPAHVCKALVVYRIDADACTGCTLCARNCPSDAITGKVKEPHLIDSDKCTRCGFCYDVCKFNAIIVE